MSGGDDRIDAYLDQLLAELRGRARDVRRILVEAEAHLRDAVDDGVAGGLSVDDAETAALERFGPPAHLARRFAAESGRLLPITVVVQAVVALALVAGIGLAGIGASGVVAGGMGSVFGKSFVAGDPPGVTYTAARCAEYLEYEPHAPSCKAAALAHHYGEVVDYRLAAGVLGLIVLAGWWVVRRRWPAASTEAALPDAFVPTVGATLFGAAAVMLIGESVGMMVFGSGDGAGALLSGGLVSLVVSGLFGVALYRALLARSRTILTVPASP